MRRIFILFYILCVAVHPLLSQPADNTINLSNDKKKRYLGITAAYSFNYMNSNINWGDIYNEGDNRYLVGVNPENYRNLIKIENYEDKHLIKYRSIPSYINTGYSVGLNYMSEIKKNGKFLYGISGSFVDNGLYYFSHVDDRWYSTVTGRYLNTFLPLIYYKTYIKTINFNFNLYYAINVYKNKIKLLPVMGLVRSQTAYTRISAYEFEGNRYIGGFNRKRFINKFDNDLFNIIFDRTFMFNYGLSLNLLTKNHFSLMFDYVLIFNHAKIWKTIINGEEFGEVSPGRTGYMLLHNVDFSNSRRLPQKQKKHLLEIKIMYNF